ncbi:MAG TPA: apolipoprotein N-acyltransferase [Lacisediminihabitans sp.]|nr:apolipoprotein N-acyltransferase [Lacisediminihabitans sp.]HXD62705.1 apolipoprotein N-acyltransferase [Lacisediminihabitans sp.]
MHPSPRPPLSLAWAAGAAALGGALNAAAFPALGWWPLIFVGTGMILWSLRGRSVAGSLLIGFIGGFSFFGHHIFWLTVYLGPIPWLALAGLESIFFALGAMLIALAWRWVPLIWTTRTTRIAGIPLVLAGLWTLREGVASVWPYGGFSWGRLAFSQSDSPFSSLVTWVGVSGLTFLLAWLSAIALQLLLEIGFDWSVRGIIATAAVLVLVAIPAWPVQSSGTMRVAAVQGNADAGLFAQHPPGTTLDDHLQATVPLFGKRADVVVWPENAADVDPLRSPQSAQVLDFVSERMHAPLVTGTITQDSKGRMFNSLLLWEAGKGAVQQYDKIHPVPFAEYLPDRAFWYPLAPDLLDMVPRDYSFGQRSNVFDIEGIKAGVAICFDIVDDSLVRRMIDGGAQLILAPTNNADFGHSDESRQQIAIARLRAIETGRSVVNISTVGMSGMFAPDGSVIAQLPDYKAGAMLENVPLSSAVTPAMVIGPVVEWLAGGIGLAGLILGLLLTLARGRRRG